MKNLKTLTTILLAVAAMLFISCGKKTTDANGCYIDIDEATAAANKKNQDIMVIITLDGDDEAQKVIMDYISKRRSDYPKYIDFFNMPLKEELPRWYDTVSTELEI